MAFNEARGQEAVAAQEAAAHDAAPYVRTVAGPGTGKSHTIEQRVNWLLANDVDPRAIVAVSFTRASAYDLQRRVALACEAQGQDASQLSVSTLHSLSLRALRAHGALAAYPVDPVV